MRYALPRRFLSHGERRFQIRRPVIYSVDQMMMNVDQFAPLGTLKRNFKWNFI